MIWHLDCCLWVSLARCVLDWERVWWYLFVFHHDIEYPKVSNCCHMHTAWFLECTLNASDWNIVIHQCIMKDLLWCHSSWVLITFIDFASLLFTTFGLFLCKAASLALLDLKGLCWAGKSGLERICALPVPSCFPWLNHQDGKGQWEELAHWF